MTQTGIFIAIAVVVIGVPLVWLVIEAALTVRKARKTISDSIEPTLASAQRITATLEPITADMQEIVATVKPAAQRIDPLIERVSLTVDAANLEVMRLDQILENVSEITESASSAVHAVESATNAPLAIVNNLSARVRGAFRSKRASDESVALGEKKAEGLPREENPVAQLASDSLDAAERFLTNARQAVSKHTHKGESNAQSTSDSPAVDAVSPRVKNVSTSGKHATKATGAKEPQELKSTSVAQSATKAERTASVDASVSHISAATSSVTTQGKHDYFTYEPLDEVDQ